MRVDVFFSSFICAKRKDRLGSGGIPQGVWMLVTGMVDVGWYGMVGVVVVGMDGVGMVLHVT